MWGRERLGGQASTSQRSEDPEQPPQTRRLPWLSRRMMLIGLIVVACLVALVFLNSILQRTQNAYLALALHLVRLAIPVFGLALGLLAALDIDPATPRPVRILRRFFSVAFVIVAVTVTPLALPTIRETRSAIELQKRYGRATAIPDVLVVARAAELTRTGHSSRFRLPTANKNRLREAVALLDQEVAQTTGTLSFIAQVHAQRAWTLAELKAIPEALNEAKLAHSLDPHNVLGNCVRCRCFRLTGRLPEADASCDAALNDDKGSALAWAEKGAVTVARSRAGSSGDDKLLSDAVSELRLALTANPGDERAWNNLGIAYLDLKQPSKALEAANHALRVEPDFEDALITKASALKRLGELEEIIPVYKRLTELNPNDAEAWNNLGEAYERQSALGTALECFRVAVRVKPDFEIAWCEIGRVLYVQGKYADSLAPLERAIELKQNDPDALVLYAGSLYYLGRIDEAELYVMRALDVAPRDAMALKLRDVVLQKRNGRVRRR